ncbi:PTS system nitrogen-specific IIA component, PtsN [hydrothermal vent metagenome]|uniref:PTS system nitrogen-specific IIA component, PtsN n=1 Tax=hydrothermal vent metagenome TaxID=652676 RepID=A0A3B0SQZ7_9ZZZZ
MTINELLSEERVFLRAKSSGKKQVLRLLASLAAKTLDVDEAIVLASLQERERLSSTGVGGGVAIPHARLDGLDQVKGIFVRFEQPISFDAVDDAPVDLFFMLLAPKQAGAEHLKALAQVSRCLRLPQMRERLRLAPDADACRMILCNDTQNKPARKTRSANA